MTEQFAQHIVNNLLQPKENDVISIAGEIYNLSQNPLVELPLIEEIALNIRKKKAFPFLEISTENLKHRFFSEMPKEIFAHSPTFYNQWIDTISAFIEIGWKNISGEFSGENNLYFKQMQSLSEKIWQKIFEQNKKVIFLNFPTNELAEHLQIDYETLYQIYLAAVLTDHFKLKLKISEIHELLTKHSKFFLRSETDILNFSIKHDKLKTFSGKLFEQQPLIVLPTGFVEIPLIRSRLNGTFYAERAYYRNSSFANIKINFEDGFVRFISVKEESEQSETLKNAVLNSKDECFLVTGCNENISDYTGYFLYDRCIAENNSVVFYDNNFERIIFSKKNSKIVINE